MGAGDHGLKSEKLGTSEGVDILTNPTAEESQPAGTGKKGKQASATGKKGKEASAPEGGDLALELKEASASEGGDLGLKSKLKEACTLGGEILKKRKEAMAALDLFLSMAKEAQPAGVGNKRKKVVKEKVPQDVIDSIIAKPCKIVQELSDEVLADQSQEFREMYKRARLLNEKFLSYEQALIKHYRVMGFVEDEIEVTDNEDEGAGEKVTDDEETWANKVTGD